VFRDIIIATIRTIVPYLVSSAALWLSQTFDFALSDDIVSGWSAALTLALGSGYYVLASFLERNVHPAFGWLLGYASAPTYTNSEQES